MAPSHVFFPNMSDGSRLTVENRDFVSHVRQRSQPSNRPPPSQTSSHCKDGFLIEFFWSVLCQTKNYFGDRHEPLTNQNYTFRRRATVWLPTSSVLLHDNGSGLSTFFRSCNIPIQTHEQLLRKIEAVARRAGTSSMLPIVVDLKYTLLTEVKIPDPDEVVDTVILNSIETYDPKPIPATISSIEGLEKVRLQHGSDSDGECIICMQEFETGSEITRMPCSHVYHGDCIVKWLKTSHFCPLCRYPMPCDD